MTWVVLPAAGRGLRAGGGLPKQYRRLLGKPLIEHTLNRLLEHPRITGVLVVLAPDDPHWPGWTRLHGKPVQVATGGAERADSVLAGLQALPSEVADADAVLVHDAARPCLSRAEIDALLQADPKHGALLALPLSDTLKQADAAASVEKTVPRQNLWRALTPQMFTRAALTLALQQADRAGIKVTDEAMAMEHVGARPRLIEGSPDNIKVTTARDFAHAEFLLRHAGADP